MIRCELPFPPPLSACFKQVTFKSRKTGKPFTTRAPTSRYTKWKKEAAKMIAYQVPRNSYNTPAAMMGEVQVMVRLVAPDRRERDADNSGKALLDALVQNHLIENDSNRYVRRLTFAWADDGCPCIVFIRPVEPKAPAQLSLLEGADK